MRDNDFDFIGSHAQTPPEELLRRMLKEDLGVEVNAQALRMFLRVRWSRVSPLAHAIHDGK